MCVLWFDTSSDHATFGFYCSEPLTPVVSLPAGGRQQEYLNFSLQYLFDTYFAQRYWLHIHFFILNDTKLNNLFFNRLQDDLCTWLAIFESLPKQS